MAQGGRRHRGGRRAAARGLDGQGRHRDPVAGRRHAAVDHGGRGRDRAGRRRARGGRRPGPGEAARRTPRRRTSRRRTEPGSRPPQEAPAQEAPKQEAPEQEAPAGVPRAARRTPSRSAPRPPTTTADEAVDDGEARAPYVTPLVRKLAAENGVDLSTLSGSGVGGRIRKQDVLAAAEKAAARAKEKEQAAPARPAAAAASSAPAAPAAAHAGQGRPRAGHHGEAAAAASGDRAADDRVAAGVGPAHHRAGGRRHPHRPAPCPGEGGVRAPRGRQAHLPAVLREGDDRGAQGSTRSSTRRSTRRARRSSTTAPCTWRSPSTPPAACSCR